MWGEGTQRPATLLRLAQKTFHPPLLLQNLHPAVHPQGVALL